MSLEEIKEIKKVIIVGSGPAGYTAAIYCARANLKPLVISGKNYGGQLMYTTEVENFPGYPESVTGPKLMQDLHEQAEKFGTEFLITNVNQIKKDGKIFELITDKGSYHTFSIIISTGAEAKWLNLENEDKLRNNGISTCAVCDGAFYKDKDVIVVGGGDTAMEEAVFLTKFANSVKIIHRSEKFQASKIELERARNNPKVSILTNKYVDKWLSKDVETDFGVISKLGGVKIKDSVNDQEDYLSIEGAFIAIGHKPSTKFLNDSGVKLDEQGYIVLPNKGENTMTTVNGIFACGDVCDKRYKQAITAAGSGCMSAIDCERWLTERLG